MIRSDWIETARGNEYLFREVVARLPVLPVTDSSGSVEDIVQRYSPQIPISDEGRLMIDGFNVLEGKFEGDGLVLIRFGERSTRNSYVKVYSIKLHDGKVPDVKDWRLVAQKKGTAAE